MKWLKDNILGTALLAGIGILLLTSMALMIVWALPVAAEPKAFVAGKVADESVVVVVQEIGPADEYQVINRRPVFNETRQPVAEEVTIAPEDESLEIAVKDAPEVKLTGVIITPGLRIASLQPLAGGQESVTAKVGEPLTGEYVGWQVTAINARDVVLESNDGQKLQLELQVHDVKIKQPPKPEPVAIAAQAASPQLDNQAAAGGQPLSRAEQIRQRIAERREELRREQQEQQSESQAEADAGNKTEQPVSYQSAIQALMKNTPRDKKSNDSNDG